jgi:hypothetical protein
MKTRLLLILFFWLFCALSLLAQPAKSFKFVGGNYSLAQVCEWLNKEQQLNISFNHTDKALQKEVSIANGTYTFERLFQQYFRPQRLDYKVLGSQIIVFTEKRKASTANQAVKQVTINGYVTDSTSGERLQGATVTILDKQLGTVSNTYGFYSLTVPEGTSDLVVNVIGYAPVFTTIHLEKDTVVAFQLTPVASTLTAVTVSANSGTSKKIPIQQLTQMSTIDMPVSAIEKMPHLLGEADVMRALQFLPGVQAGNEASSGLYVRGGSPDQNLILLDGVPVYNASHLFGLFSVFNTDAIQSVQLYKGGFPARFGGRLSSVIDIRMKEGNKNTLHGEGSIGLLSSRLTLEGPIQKGKSSFMVSGRATNWAPLMRLVSKSATKGDEKYAYGYYDLNAKVNFKLGEKDHLYMSGYFGRDKFAGYSKGSDTYANETEPTEYHFEGGMKWGNATAVARWNHQFSKKIFSNTTLHFSKYAYTLYAEDETMKKADDEYYRYYFQHASDLNDLAAKFDLDIIPNTRHYIRTGVSAVRHQFLPGAYLQETQYNNQKEKVEIGDGVVNTMEYDVYAEDDWCLTTKLKANVGLHASAFTVQGRSYTSLQPRLGVRYLLSDRLSLKGSAVSMNQYIHLLSNPGVGLPTDLWVPVTKRIPPQRSEQYALGMAYTSPKNIEVSVEGYYKNVKNVLEYQEGAAFINTSVGWENRVTVGVGSSRGIEFLVQKKKGRTTGLLAYTLSYTDRTFATINNGETFPYQYDRRHDFKVSVNHTLAERKGRSTELSANWVYGTGQALTLPLQTYSDDRGQLVTVYSNRNGIRTPAYHRGDISISFNKQKSRYYRSWVIGAYNVYNNQNPLFISYKDNKYWKAGALPVLPSISYQFKF